ncbi:MAG: hypothetical protein H5T86_15770, partial [Armatimonadetes bacterium]|nr:hypothetical protein [Armatimonadota bacterium]
MKTVERLAGRALLAWIVGSFLLSAVIPHEAWATPMVAITRPAPGAVVTAEVWVDVVYQSSSSDPIVRLELLVDEAVVRQHVLPSPRLKGEASFSYTFQTEAGELHRLSVRAIDSRGAIGEASINVQVRKVSAPPSQDQVPPVVNIYYPHEGEQVSGNVEIKVDARDNVGVEWVFIYLDGKIKAMIKGAPPYIDRWDTTKTSDGVHVLQAKAWDAAENQGSSAPVQVAVANRNRTLPQSPSGEAPVPLTGTVPAGPEPGRAPTAPEAAQRQPSEREPAPAQGLVPTSGAQSTARAGVVPPAPVRTVGRPEESGTAKASGQSVSPATVAAAREYSGAPVAQASTV